MALKLKPTSEQVIVVTGASSGIGLATAKMAAQHGAKVVLAARNEEALAEACRDITSAGGRAEYYVIDVADADAVEGLGQFAVEKFGRIDTWVNDAGVDIWGELLDIPNEDSRRLFETNFWGVVFGSRTAAAHLRDHGGALITVASVASDRAFPLQGIYCASKHAVKAYMEALRMELEQARVPISVTLIKPSSIATPLPQQAKNYLEREPKLPSPMYAPEEVARAIVYAASNPKRDIYVGLPGRILGLLGAVAPRLMDIVGEKLLYEAQERNQPAMPRQDNLYKAGVKGGLVEESPDGRKAHASIGTRVATRSKITKLGVLAVSGALAWVALRAAAETRVETKR